MFFGKKKGNKTAEDIMRERAYVCMLSLVVVGFGFVIRNLYQVQFVEGEAYKKRALNQQMYTTQIAANRGTIYDRNGNILAVSETVWDVLFSPANVSDEEAVILAKGMSEILGADPDYIIEKAKNKNNFYQVIEKKVDKDTVDLVLAFASENSIPGVYLEESTRRTYPYGTLASNLLGFVNDLGGAYGMEAYYNTMLTGTPGRVVTARTATGTDMPFRYQDEYAPQDGNSIVTTIDATVQQIVEKHMRTAVIEHGVQNRASAIFMDINTGEILAMTTMMDFDPNNPTEIIDPLKILELDNLYGSDDYISTLSRLQLEQWNNKAISEPYEPGSVFKIITLAAALEVGVTNVNSQYYCPGYHMVGTVRKNCWQLTGHGPQDLAATVRNSCNPAFMMIGSALGAENFYHYFEGFGLTQSTGIPLPGEANGVYHSESALANPLDYENSLTSVSFGQTFKVTPLQMINAVAASCNGGYLYEPTLIKQIVNSQGNIVEMQEPVLQRQIVSEETSQIVCDILETVVSDGSGRLANIPGYRIGGKTGTSEKIDIEDQTGEKLYILSFVGVAPMDDPQYACLVLLDEPEVENAFGSTMAAPIVGAIFDDALQYLGIEKVFTESEKELDDVTMSNYIGNNPHTATSSAAQRYLSAVIVGDGATVIEQSPPTGTMVPRGSTVILYTDNSWMEVDKVEVPDVRGKTGMVANQLIINSGLNIRVEGVSHDNQYAVAAIQDIPPGTEVDRGTVITVTFTAVTPSTAE